MSTDDRFSVDEIFYMIVFGSALPISAVGSIYLAFLNGWL